MPKHDKLLEWSFYLLVGLLLTRLIGIRVPIIGAAVFAFAGVVFLRNITQDWKGMLNFILGFGLLFLAYTLFVTGVSPVYSAAGAAEAMASTPLTDFFLNATNVIAAAVAGLAVFVWGRK